MKGSTALHSRWRIILVTSEGAYVYRSANALPGPLDTPGTTLAIPTASGEQFYPLLAGLPASVSFFGWTATVGDIGIRRVTVRLSAPEYPSGRPLRALIYQVQGDTTVLRYNGIVTSVVQSPDRQEWVAVSGFEGAAIRLKRAGEVFGQRAMRPRDPLPVVYSAGEFSGGPGIFPTTLVFEESRPAGPADDFAALYVISAVPLAEVVAVYENGVLISGDPLVTISAGDPVPLDPDFQEFGPPMAWVFFRRRPQGPVTVDVRSLVFSPISALQDFVTRFAGWTRFDPGNAAKDTQLVYAGLSANYLFTEDETLEALLKRWEAETGLEAELTPQVTLRMSAREPRTLVRQIQPDVQPYQLRGEVQRRFDAAESPREVVLSCNYAWARRTFGLTVRSRIPGAPRDAPQRLLDRKAIWMIPVAAQAILDDIAPSFSGHSLRATVEAWDGDAMQPGRVATISGEPVELESVEEDPFRDAVRVSGRVRTAPLTVPAHPTPMSVVARANSEPLADCDQGTAEVRVDPGQPVYFRACVIGGSGVFQYAWNFGDGEVGSGEAVTHIYGSAGRFAVRVTATDLGTGKTATAYAGVIVQAPLLAWGLLWRCPGAPYQRSHETDTVIPPTAYANATRWADGTLSGEWDWGDGTPPSPGFRAFHRYDYRNVPFTEYTVTFRLRRGSESYSDPDPRMVVQEPFASGGRAVRAMVSSPGQPRNPCTSREHRWYTNSLPLTLEFSAQLTNWTMPAITWTWGDGTPADTGNSVTHSFSGYGNYLVRAAVSETGGAPVIADVLRIVIRPELTLQAEASVNDGAWVTLPATIPARIGDLVRIRVANLSGGDGLRVVRWQDDGAVLAYGDAVAFYLSRPGTRRLLAEVADAQGAIASTNAAGQSQYLVLEVT